MRNLILLIIVSSLTIVSCNSTNNEDQGATIPEKYHGVWSESVQTSEGSLEYYLDITTNSITYHVQREYTSNRCFEDPISYTLKDVDSNTYIFERTNTNNTYQFEFSDVEVIDDGTEVYSVMNVSSDAVYSGEYGLNEEQISFSPQCVD